MSHSLASSSSFYTESSLSTEWGPGTLSGKAVLALGEATLRGIDNIVIRVRLAAIRSHFPHNNTTSITNIEKIYSDILEFSRPEIYSERVRQDAIRLALVQIAHRQVYHLVQALVKWPSAEASFFMRQIMWQNLTDKICLAIGIDRHLQLPRGEQNDVPSLIYFLSEVAESSTSLCQTVLDIGFLDLLLYIFLDGFGLHYFRSEGWTDLRGMCNSALVKICTRPDGFGVVPKHPFYILWPERNRLPLVTLEKHRLEARRNTWRLLDVLAIELRVKTISHFVARSWMHDKIYLVDVCIDLLEFIGGAHPYRDVDVGRTMRCLSNYASSHMVHLEQAMRVCLSHIDYAALVDMFSHILYRLSSIVIRAQTPLFYGFEDIKPGYKPSPRATSTRCMQCLEVFVIIARDKTFVKKALVEGGILALLFLVTKQELRVSGILYAEPLSVEFMRDLAELLYDEEPIWVHRRILWDAFRALFSGEDCVGDAFLTVQEIFRTWPGDLWALMDSHKFIQTLHTNLPAWLHTKNIAARPLL